MTTFVDSNVVIYLADPGDRFHAWAMATAMRRRVEGPLIISDIVYSEVSAGYDSLENTDAVVNALALERMRFSNAVLFRAARAFREYRRRRGTKTNVLPDFLIGAQAETADAPLMTNNRKDYTFYFPELRLIEPG